MYPQPQSQSVETSPTGARRRGRPMKPEAPAQQLTLENTMAVLHDAAGDLQLFEDHARSHRYRLERQAEKVRGALTYVEQQANKGAA